MSRGVAYFLLLACFAACTRPAGRLTRIEGATMGTTYCVKIVDLSPDLDARRLHARVEGVLRAIERKMSTYEPESELSRFNASDTTDWFTVSADTVKVIDESLRVSHLTQGAFDVTVDPLVVLWGFGPNGERRRPTPDAISAALAGVGFERLETRAAPPALRKRIPGLRVDLSAIAKGFAIDQLANLLAAEGARDYLVEIGGEVRASGRNPGGEPWRIVVERPQSGDSVAPCLLHLSDLAVATSGDYRNAFEEDGLRYAHVIDPHTGQPVSTGVASATVLSASAMEADAFATALMVLPVDEGLRLAEREGLAARILVRRGDGLVERRTVRFPEGGL